MFFKITGKSNTYQFYLPNFLKFCDNISHKLLKPSQFLKKIYRNRPDPSPYSMLQDVGRKATPKLATTNSTKYLQILVNNIDNGVRKAGLRIYVRYWR